jgi:hypothetical protein
MYRLREKVISPPSVITVSENDFSISKFLINKLFSLSLSLQITGVLKLNAEKPLVLAE